MSKTERIRYEMLLRIRDFGTTYRERFPEGSAGAQVFARVAEATAQVDAHVLAKALAAKEGRQVRLAARTTLLSRMRAVSRTARDISRNSPGIEPKLQMPERTSDGALLDGARRFLTHAGTMPERFIALGMPPTFLDDLRQAADALEEAVGDRRVGRSTVTAAQAGITRALASGTTAARSLDVIVPNTVGDDPVILAAWERDRRLVDGKGKPDPADTPLTPAAGAPAPATRATTPVATDDLKKAS